MTPEQRARFLYTDMFAITGDDYCAKQCALKTVDEIVVNVAPHISKSKEYVEFTNYWKEVRKIIPTL